MIYETLQICWHKVDDEPSHVSKTETLLSPAEVLCARQTMPSGTNTNRTSQLHHNSYTVKKIHPAVPTVSDPVKPVKRTSHPFLGLALAGVTRVCGRVNTDGVCRL